MQSGDYDGRSREECQCHDQGMVWFQVVSWVRHGMPADPGVQRLQDVLTIIQQLFKIVWLVKPTNYSCSISKEESVFRVTMGVRCGGLIIYVLLALAFELPIQRNISRKGLRNNLHNHSARVRRSAGVRSRETEILKPPARIPPRLHGGHKWRLDRARATSAPD